MGTAAFFLLLTVQLMTPAVVAGALALAMILRWLWRTDRGPTRPPVDIGGGVRVPVYITGSCSHSWWGMVVLILVAGDDLGLPSVLVLLSLEHRGRVAAARATAPAWGWPATAAAAWIASSGLVVAAQSRPGGQATARFRWLLAAGTLVMVAALALDVAGHVQAGLAPSAHGYGATVATVFLVQALFVATLVIMVTYTLARSWRQLLGSARRVTFDNTMLLWQYAVAQAAVGLVTLNVLPRWLG